MEDGIDARIIHSPLVLVIPLQGSVRVSILTYRIGIGFKVRGRDRQTCMFAFVYKLMTKVLMM